VAQALSRLAKGGVIERLSKGVYYRARQTTLGKSRPNPASLQKLVSAQQKMFPAGLAAANLLGFTTQSGPQVELATSRLSLPRKLLGRGAVIHTRRPEAWGGLTEIACGTEARFDASKASRRRRNMGQPGTATAKSMSFVARVTLPKMEGPRISI
jgi:predicted transcriptional regulator of viral defense system